ncbi:MAG: helix-turn-helix domain-containing protein [Nocardiopsaceae bacterium]|nr:helix-turn-helix domain-containing protein [Nocardiopsaceae bacterium]
MSIGEQLAEARREAGLTVAEVCRKTRIREPIVQAIERDDFTTCGGDFYARGFIREIARAVGTDAAPLVSEYDVEHRWHDPAAATEVPEPLTPVEQDGRSSSPGALDRESGRGGIGGLGRERGRGGLGGLGSRSDRGGQAGQGGRRRPNVTILLALALAVVVGFAIYQLVSAATRPSSSTGGTGSNVASGRHHAVSPVARSPAPSPSGLIITLTAVEDCWVEFTRPGGRVLFQSYVVAGASKQWTFRHAVDMQLGNPGGVKLAVNGSNPLPPGVSHPVTLRLGHRGGPG